MIVHFSGSMAGLCFDKFYTGVEQLELPEAHNYKYKVIVTNKTTQAEHAIECGRSSQP